MTKPKSNTKISGLFAVISGIVLQVIFATGARAQDIAQGSWRTHFSYSNARIIENTGNKLFCAAENGFFFVDTSDNTINVLSKIDGFSDVTISALGYSSAANSLVIGYENGNIDLFSDRGITNIDLVKTQNIIQEKTIRHISINGATAYLSTDFGIVVIDLNREVIDEVYREIGPDGEQPEVFQTAIFRDSIFAPTSLGLLKARLDDNINLLDFNNWESVATPLMAGSLFEKVATTNESLYFATNTEVYSYNSNSFSSNGNMFTDISKLRGVDSKLFVIDADGAHRLDEDQFVLLPLSQFINIQDIYPFDNGFWVAAGVGGLLSRSGSTTRILSPAGPKSDHIQKLVSQGDTIFAFGPYRTESFLPADQSGYSVFLAGRWDADEILNLSNVSDIEGPYVASYSAPLFNRFLARTVPSSPLLVSDRTVDDIIVPDIERGPQGLWVANRDSDLPLHLLASDGTWQSFDLDGSMDNIEQVAVSGAIWMRENTSSGITVFDPESGEISRSTANNSDLPSSRINDIVIDQDDEVWVATADGVAFYPSASLELSDFNTAIVPVFENNFLFREETINCITVDPGNRKWFGNTTGAWLLEEAGESLVLQFNTDNSPLPSNNVLDIAINPLNGEVFILTDKGMVSYRSDATTGSATHGNVKIFPNPVRPGFNGLVGINGLAGDVRLKITDVSGKLIRELEASGGGASWNLMDINGNRAQTGVYLIFSSDSNGVETFVGKLAIVN
ncbi:MAG: two-component regulator propeller domain-containing protein [Bacteroidota bacterium]